MGGVRAAVAATVVAAGLALLSIATAPPAAADDACSDKGPVTRPFASNPRGLPAAEVAMLSDEGRNCSCTPQKVWHSGLAPAVADSLRAAMRDKEAQSIRNYAAFGVPASRVPASDRVIWIRSALRTTDEQRCLRARLGRWAALPGRSTHEWGLAVDIEDWEHGDDDAHLLAHGWCRTVPSEPWHFEHRPSLEFFGMSDRCIK